MFRKIFNLKDYKIKRYLGYNIMKDIARIVKYKGIQWAVHLARVRREGISEEFRELPIFKSFCPYLKHCITVGVWKSCFKTRETSSVVLVKITVFHAHLWILDINLTVALWNCNEICLFSWFTCPRITIEQLWLSTASTMFLQFICNL